MSELGLKFARGTFPTSHGLIHINHELINNEVRTKVKAPTQVKVIEDVKNNTEFEQK